MFLSVNFVGIKMRNEEFTKKKFYEIVDDGRCGRCWAILKANPLKYTEVILSNKFMVDDHTCHYFICDDCERELQEWLTASSMLSDKEKKSIENGD